MIEATAENCCVGFLLAVREAVWCGIWRERERDGGDLSWVQEGLKTFLPTGTRPAECCTDAAPRLMSGWCSCCAEEPNDVLVLFSQPSFG